MFGFGKDPSVIDPSHYEACLKKNLLRLKDLAESAGVYGVYFNLPVPGISRTSNAQTIDALAAWIRKSRIHGFCALKAAEEGMNIIAQISAQVEFLEGHYEQTSQESKLENLEGVAAVVLEVGPVLKETISTLSHFRSLDEKEILETMLAGVAERMRGAK